MGARGWKFEFGKDKNIQCIVLGLRTRGLALRLRRITGCLQRTFGHTQNKSWIWVTNLEVPCQKYWSTFCTYPHIHPDLHLTMKQFSGTFSGISPPNHSQKKLFSHSFWGNIFENGYFLSCVLGLALLSWWEQLLLTLWGLDNSLWWALCNVGCFVGSLTSEL